MLDNKFHLVINNDKIIKVVKEDEFYHYGYNILTEEFEKLFKHKSIPATNILLKLIGCEKTRIQIASVLTTNNKEAIKLLNVSEKTYYRMRERNKV